MCYFSGLWIMAAKFEFEVMVSPSSARALFQRALRMMPQEKKLWLEVNDDSYCFESYR